MPGEDARREGYLVVADLAGYTAFLAGTELEHAQAIVEELLATLRRSLVPPLRFVKVEGDAVFCYAETRTFAEGERLAELLEVCYFDFSNHLLDMARSTTCRCAACASIGSLDLKFVAHHGTFLVRRADNVEDVASPDVILVHRLLKNSIAERMSCSAYVFFTATCLEHLPESFTAALPAHTEPDETLGETAGAVHDLKPVVREMREARREYVGSADADFETKGEQPVPPAVFWQYFVDPEKRLRWQPGNQTSIKTQANERGRLGLGASSHCAHGRGSDLLRRYVDWRPFHYFTNTSHPITSSLLRFPPCTETTEFIAREDGGTDAHYRLRLHNRSWLSRMYFRLLVPLLRRQFEQATLDLTRLLEEDGLVTSTAGERVREDADIRPNRH
jgi:hypothetical protein